MVDAFAVGMVTVLLVFVFAAYLFVRRIITGFKEGVQQAQQDQRR